MDHPNDRASSSGSAVYSNQPPVEVRDLAGGVGVPHDVRDRLGQQPVPLLALAHRLERFAPLGHVEAQADESGERARREPRRAAGQHPAVLVVVALEPVLQFERAPVGERGGVRSQVAVAVLGVNVVGPPVPEFLLQHAPGELHPRLVEVRALSVPVGDPDECRRGVGEVAEPLLALAQGVLGLQLIGDVPCDHARAEVAPVGAHGEHVDLPHALGTRPVPRRAPQLRGERFPVRPGRIAVPRQQVRREVGHHLGQRVPGVCLDRLPVGGGEVGVDPNVPQVGVEERDAERGVVEERVEPREGFGRFALRGDEVRLALPQGRLDHPAPDDFRLQFLAPRHRGAQSRSRVALGHALRFPQGRTRHPAKEEQRHRQLAPQPFDIKRAARREEEERVSAEADQKAHDSRPEPALPAHVHHRQQRPPRRRDLPRGSDRPPPEPERPARPPESR